MTKWYEAPTRFQQTLRCAAGSAETIADEVNDWDVPATAAVSADDRVLLTWWDGAETVEQIESWLREGDRDCELEGVAVDVGPDPEEVARLAEELRAFHAVVQALVSGVGVCVYRVETAEPIRGVVQSVRSDCLIVRIGHDGTTVAIPRTADVIRQIDLVPVYCPHETHMFDRCYECAKNVRLYVDGLRKRPIA